MTVRRLGTAVRRLAVPAAGLALVLAGGGGLSSVDAAGKGRQQKTRAHSYPEIRVLSTRSNIASDGDALVEVLMPGRTRPGKSWMSLNGRNVTSRFRLQSKGRYLGVLEGLRRGDNVATARVPSGSGARLTITNHPIGGPATAGPQIQP